MESKNKHSHDELLGKWLNNNLSQREKDELAGNNGSSLSKYESIRENLNQLHLMESIDSHKALHNVKQRLKHSIKLKRYLNYLQRIAAILLLPLLGYVLYSQWINSSSVHEVQMSWNEISTPIGLRSTYTLPDGTQVELNGGTSIKFPNLFSGNERVVELEGEAFFDVFTNKKMPFVVKCGKINIQATGTAFNVQAYRGSNNVITALTEGSVNILFENSGNRTKLMSMVPGDVVDYNILSNQLNRHNADIYKYLGWRSGELIFKNDALPEVLRRLSLWYNVDFDVVDGIDDRYAYTGSFKEERLDHILHYIELTTPLKFIYVNSKITNNNKQLIKVELK